jgi:hypothetical protein
VLARGRIIHPAPFLTACESPLPREMFKRPYPGSSLATQHLPLRSSNRLHHRAMNLRTRVGVEEATDPDVRSKHARSTEDEVAEKYRKNDEHVA